MIMRTVLPGLKDAPAMPCDQLETHGGDRLATIEITRDTASSYLLRCALKLFKLELPKW